MLERWQTVCHHVVHPRKKDQPNGCNASMLPLRRVCTPSVVLEKFAAIQIIDVHVPTTDGPTAARPVYPARVGAATTRPHALLVAEWIANIGLNPLKFGIRIS